MSKKKVQKLACVYGEEIMSLCAVRVLLSTTKPSKPKEPDISKYIQPNDPAFKDVQRMMGSYTTMLDKLLNQEYSTLSYFCRNCPQRNIYIKKKLLV